MSAKTPEEEALEVWKKGTQVEVKRDRPSSSVLSLRLPKELFEEISDLAEAKGMSVSAFGRDLIEKALANQSPSTPLDVATMFNRWALESMEGVRLSTFVSPAIRRDSWVHFCFGSTSFEASHHDLLTDIRAGEVGQSSTASAGSEQVA
ncbi:MAG: hypothetical protein ABIS18_01155 [Actinomycetota bacterium]